MPIITRLKEYLKNLRILFDIPRFIGPLATVAFTIVYHAAAVYFGLTITLIWLTVFVVGGTFLSGLRGGGVAVLWAAAYALYTLPLDGAIQIIIGLTLIVAVVGWETRKLREEHTRADSNQEKADLVDNANGNIEKLKMALKTLDDLLQGWQVLSDPARRGLVEDTRNRLATLALLVYGWRALAKERRQAQELKRAQDDD